MSAAMIALVVMGVLVLLMVAGLGVAVYLKNGGKPKMTRFETTAVSRRVSSHLQKQAEEAAFAKVASAMGYELSDELAE